MKRRFVPRVSSLTLVLLLVHGNSIAGGAGSCLAFDGVDDFVRVTRSAALEPGEITIELWAKIDGLQDWNSRLLRKGDHYTYFITADQDLDQRMQLLVTQGKDYWAQAKDGQSHTAYDGTWHHFLGMYTAYEAQFWVDGTHVSTVTHGLGLLKHDPLIDLYFGAGLPVELQNEYFKGELDEIRIWDYPRTPLEIQSTWSAALVGTEPGLVGYWRFDEGAGQVAHDSSLLGHHGQLGATPLAEPSDPEWRSSGVPLGPCSGHAVNYCESTVNSSGFAAHIELVGSLSISANAASLVATHAAATSPGTFFYGLDAFHAPMADGYLCVSPFAPGLFRLPIVQTNATGSAQIALDFDALAGAGAITPGSTWRFQFWFRDLVPGGAGSNLSDALELAFCP